MLNIDAADERIPGWLNFGHEVQLDDQARLPIADGRKVTYTRHAHEHFSIGAITTGCSYYHYGARTFEISAGTVVLMNPGDVHACNPIHDQPWSYHMLYLDTPWLTDLQYQLGFSTDQGYRPFDTPHTRDTGLYHDLLDLYRTLVDEQAELLQKQSALVSYFTEVQQRLNPSLTPVREVNHKLERAADYIRAQQAAAASWETAERKAAAPKSSEPCKQS